VFLLGGEKCTEKKKFTPGSIQKNRNYRGVQEKSDDFYIQLWQYIYRFN
jgi:hypothetical protein